MSWRSGGHDIGDGDGECDDECDGDENDGSWIWK